MSGINVNDANLRDFAIQASEQFPGSTTLRVIAEAARQSQAEDRKFLRQYLYYFELRVPASVAGGAPGSYLYPLILAPQSLSMSEPFLVDEAVTNGGGLFVEELGIVRREIVISGTTGWEPKRSPKMLGNTPGLITPKNRGWSRTTTSKNRLVPLSGQRHLQFLQDTVFRTYADLKQDPSTSEGTELHFHNVKDDEHWRVIPREFSLNRDTSSPLTYMFKITMTAVLPSSVTNPAFTEDQSVLAALKDRLRTIRTGIGTVRAGLADVSAVNGELKQGWSGFVGLLDGANSVVGAAENFVTGQAEIIRQPFALVENSVRAGLDALLQIETGEVTSTAVGPPANLLNSIRKITDGLSLIGSYPTSFQTTVQQAVARYQQRRSLAASRRSDELAEAASRIPQTIRDFAERRGLMPGDALLAATDMGLGGAVPNYSSAREYIVAAGDTLATLAAQFLGDARLWRVLAVFNDLRPPYVSPVRLPGAVTTGDTILIPTFDVPPDAEGPPVTLGVRVEEPAEVHTLGRDLRMEPVGNGLFDLIPDKESGAVDVRVVAGVENLKQAIRTRLITERGTDILYKQLGTERLVGLGITEVDLETAQFRLVNAVAADPRVAAVRKLEFGLTAADAVGADMDVEVRGISRPERISVTVS